MISLSSQGISEYIQTHTQTPLKVHQQIRFFIFLRVLIVLESRATFEHQPTYQIYLFDLQYQMNTEQRALTLNKFVDHLDTFNFGTSEKFISDINELEFNQDNLPRLDVVEDLMAYHKDITSTIQGTYNQVRDVMVHMKELKNRKKNVQIVVDSMTACLQIKRLYYGLGKEPKQIHNNLQTYFQIRGKVYHMDKFIDRIQKDIVQIQKEYQAIFDSQMSKNNSNSIGEISKILQLIRSHAGESSKPDTFHQIADLCVNSAKKEFKDIEQSLFAIPIVGNSESNYMFFDMAKNAMKIIVSLSGNCKSNVFKVSGEEGYIHVLKTLFELVTSGIIYEILMRLRKYYQIEKIVINQSKFVLKEKEFKQLQPFFKEYVAIWNQLERLKIHLLGEISQNCSKKQDLKMALEGSLNNTQILQINMNSITFMQAMMRFRFDKLLKKNRFVGCICTLDNEFFKEVNEKNLVHNTHVQDFLEETINRISEGVEKALQTLNTMAISAIINFTNHNLIYEDVFYTFNQLFSRVFTKLPSSDPKVQNAMILTLNSISAFTRALKLLTHIKLPEEVPEERIKAELQEVINNNEDKTSKVLQNMIIKIVSAEWFRFQLQKDYQKILDKWMGLENDCFHTFVQEVCKIHAEITLETEFSKKYTHVTALNFQREIRAKISFYERYSHSILIHFKKILDYIEVLQLENQSDLLDFIVRFRGVHNEEDLKRIAALRS